MIQCNVSTTLVCLTIMAVSIDSALSQDPLGVRETNDLTVLRSIVEAPKMELEDQETLDLEPFDQPVDDLQAEHSADYLAMQSFHEFGCNYCQQAECGCHDRCGCNTRLFPWTPGHGVCDKWCVGPKWAVAVDGLVLSRDDADWARVTGIVPDPQSGEVQFDQGPGARIYVTGYNDSRFGLQIGYEGINTWNASSSYSPANATRRFDYETAFNSVEINFFPKVPYPIKFFSGFRYVEVDEDFIDSTTVDKTIPLPADPPVVSPTYVDTGRDILLKNRLFGFQLGARRDTWKWNEWLALELFANAGIYNNRFKRADVTRSVTTIITGDDLATSAADGSTYVSRSYSSVRTDVNDIAFLSEVGITGVVRFNRCMALRCGYQALVLDGVGEGLDAYFAGGMSPTTQFHQGLHIGVEYRR